MAAMRQPRSARKDKVHFIIVIKKLVARRHADPQRSQWQSVVTVAAVADSPFPGERLNLHSIVRKQVCHFSSLSIFFQDAKRSAG